MTPLQLARDEWERRTTPHPKVHYIGKKAFTDDFRQYGQAIAWLEWYSDYILISKIEALQTGRGDAARLIQFLKELCDKYRVRLLGNAVVYQPDPPAPVGTVLSQEQLERWYRRFGFLVRRITGTPRSEIAYPDFPVR